MKNEPFQQGLQGCLIGLLSIVLTISAMAVSTNYYHAQHPACRGMLGAGFPVLFICDDWGGGSPTGSWGRLDFVDVLNGGIRLGGFFVDFLFYILLILISWFALSGVMQTGINRRDLWWTTFILLGFVSGFLFAFLAVWSSDSYIRQPPVGTPTPGVPSPTAVEGIPFITTATLVP